MPRLSPRSWQLRSSTSVSPLWPPRAPAGLLSAALEQTQSSNLKSIPFPGIGGTTRQSSLLQESILQRAACYEALCLSPLEITASNTQSEMHTRWHPRMNAIKRGSARCGGETYRRSIDRPFERLDWTFDVMMMML